MQLRIIPEKDYLRVELTGRESAEDVRQAIASALSEVRSRQIYRVLAVVRASRPLFKLEEYGLSEILGEIAGEGPWRIALVADTPDLRVSHQYVALVARQRGIDVRAWEHEAAALGWLKSGEPSPRYRFTRAMLSSAPDERGVYALWQDDELIYYGRAQGGEKTIRSCLLDHYFGNVDPLTERATHYSWESSDDPAAREAELLHEYQETYGHLPRCNQKSA